MDWPISWGKVKSQLSVAPPLYLKEPVNITWDGEVKEENVFDETGYKLSAAPLSLEELDGATITCIYANREFKGVCHVVSDSSGNELDGLQAPFFAASERVPNVYFIGLKPSPNGDIATVGTNVLCDVVAGDDIPVTIPSGLYTPVATSDDAGQLRSIQSNKAIVQISDPYKDFFAAMPHGVYNITVNNLIATTAGTEITDADLIAQLNTLPKQAGFLMNLRYGAANATYSAYPGVSITGDEYGCFINFGSNTLAFGNKNGTWKFYMLGSE